MGSPPPPHGFPSPRIKYHMVKYDIWNLCWKRFAIEGEGLPCMTPPPPWGSYVMGFLPGGGGGEVCHMVLFPPKEVLLWDFFRGEGLPYVIPSEIHGENMPYGIISGYHCHGICSLIMKCVYGGGGDLP